MVCCNTALYLRCQIDLVDLVGFALVRRRQAQGGPKTGCSCDGRQSCPKIMMVYISAVSMP